MAQIKEKPVQEDEQLLPPLYWFLPPVWLMPSKGDPCMREEKLIIGGNCPQYPAMTSLNRQTCQWFKQFLTDVMRTERLRRKTKTYLNKYMTTPHASRFRCWIPSAAMPSSRSSVSSEGSDLPAAQMSMSKRWATLETVGRCMFLFSVAFFILGVLLTVFGFSNTGIDPTHRLPLQILGPLCLAMTLVMWGVGCVFSRLWNMEWKRQQQAMELRDRVQLHALAMDILNNPVISPAMLQDPRIRRQLMMKLRQQKALDVRYVSFKFVVFQ